MCAVSTSRNSSGRQAPYHHGNLRVALVDAGLRLLVEGGQAGFSLREAARAVGVTVNASYRHFANKDALLAAIAAEGFRRFAAALAAGAAGGESPELRLLGAGRAYVEFARQNPALFRLMFGHFDAGAHGSELAAAANAANNVLRDGIATLLGQPADATAVSIAVLRAWSLAHGLSHLVMDGRIDANRPDYAAIVDGVLAGFRP